MAHKCHVVSNQWYLLGMHGWSQEAPPTPHALIWFLSLRKLAFEYEVKNQNMSMIMSLLIPWLKLKANSLRECQWWWEPYTDRLQRWWYVWPAWDISLWRHVIDKPLGVAKKVAFMEFWCKLATPPTLCACMDTLFHDCSLNNWHCVMCMLQSLSSRGRGS